jgi:molecular chaperone DnaK (HSP70)
MSAASPELHPDPIIGIDLGTTNSLVAVANIPHPSAPRILPDSRGRAMLPSVVRFDSTGKSTELGYEARASAVAHPLSTISSVKRLMGRSIADAAADLPYLSFKVVEGPQNTARIALPIDNAAPKIVSPQEVSAIILRRLKEQASAALGVEVRRAVVTVPAYFDDAQRQATRDAGRLAGLEVVRIVNEPTAAALAYGLGLRQAAGAATKPSIVVVYDLGGGTFDVSILKISPAEGIKGPRDQGTKALDSILRSHDPSIPSPPTVSDFFQVLSTSGDTHLGGDDFDNALVALFTREINQQFGPTTFPPETVQALRQLAEGVKIRLSTENSAAIRLDLDNNHLYSRTITRTELEALIDPLIERTIESCARALKDARRAINDLPIDAVILVGGATRTPLVRSRVKAFFNIEPYTALNPDEVVALGAAVQASILGTPPLRGGPSGQSAALLLDVVPLSLGLETVGGAMAKLILRNSTVPARATEMFSTSVDNQAGIKIHVLQGEREMAADCRSLGRFELKGIPPMPAGIPKLRVEFAVDASGILTVRAAEERSGKRLEAQIVPNHGLTPEEVDRIERESFAHAREDMTQHRIVDLIANARLDLHWITRQLTRLGTDLPSDIRADVEAHVANLRTTVDQAAADWKSVNPDELHRLKDALDKSSVRVHEIAIAKSLRDSAQSEPPR